MTIIAKALVKTEHGKLKVENNTLLCCCPDCNAPMTIRIWLSLANCWRCGTSIQLTFDQIRQLENAQPKPEHHPRQATAKPKQLEPAFPESSNPFRIAWPFVISFLLNALIILILALLFFTQAQPRKVIDLELKMVRPGNQNKSVMDLAPIAVTKPEVAKVSKTPKPISVQTEPDTSGQGDQVTFFNTKASGNRFIYIIDRSGSMNTVGTSLRGICRSYQARFANSIRSRFDSARRELVRSVASLNSNQEFYVFLFSDDATFMFDSTNQTLPDLVPATAANKSELSTWLNECVVDGSTNPTLAIQIALAMQPDAIFLLSDGAFMIPRGRPKPISVIRRKGIPIHTIAYEDEFAQTNLKRISQRTGGEFRFVPMMNRTKRILNSTNPLEAASYLRSLSHLPMQGWTWKKRFEFAKLILNSAQSGSLEHSLYLGALQNLALGIRPEIDPRDSLGDWELQPLGIKEWASFWNEADLVYQLLKKGQPIDVSILDSGKRLAGFQILSDCVVQNRNSLLQENYENNWVAFLNSTAREKLVQAKEKREGISADNTPVAFDALCTLGLLISDFDKGYGDLLFTQHDRPIDKITIAKTLIEFQDQVGVLKESHFLLEQIFKSQSPSSSSENLNRKWISLFNRTVDLRQSKAKSLYRKYQRASSDLKTVLAKQIHNEYPETSYARLVNRRQKMQ